MSEARLNSAVLTSALSRRAEQLGGFAAVLAKGDPTSGHVLIQLLEKGRISGLFERLLTASGAYAWARTGPQDIEKRDVFEDYLARRRLRDPDLWIIELDVPDVERFVADSLSGA